MSRPKLSQWNLKTKLALGFGLVLAFLVVNTVISLNNLRHVIDNSVGVTHIHTVLAELQDVLSMAQDIETGTRGFVITGDERYLEPYKAATLQMQSKLDRLDTLVHVEKGRKYLPLLQREIHDTIETNKSVVEARRNKNVEAARHLVRTGTGKNQMDLVRNTIADITAIETELLDQRNAGSKSSTRGAFINFTIAAAVSLGLLALVYYMFGRSQLDAAEWRNAQNIVDTVREPHLILDSSLRVVSANRAYYETFQTTKDATEGQYIYDLGNGQWNDPDLRLLLKDVVPKGSVFDDFELEHSFPHIGRKVVLLNARKLLAGHHGELLVLAMDDVTERRRAEEEAAKAKQIAEAANRTKSMFLANMSHELRTPLNAILGYSEMLQEEAVERELDEFSADLDKINVAGRHLLALINDILDLSKIEAGKMELFLEDFDVTTMINEVASTLQPMIAKNNNSLKIISQPTLGSMHADQVKVRQALFNLLSNSAKFTNSGSITLDAGRKRMDGSDWIVFRVTDTGIGMSPEQIVKLFQNFTQADTSTTRKFGGTGLGLSLTRQFCQLMGGDVTVKSVAGVGSTFTITIPCSVSELQTSLAAQKNQTEPAVIYPVAGMDAKPVSPIASCVLVIDDDPVQRDLLQRFLSNEGFTVRVASTGQEGLRLARALQPVAITLDVMMPDMDGWSVLSALKSDDAMRNIPVIMLTMVDDPQQGFTLGAADYATKPVNRQRLSEILRKYTCPNPPCPVLLIEDDPAIRAITRNILEKEGWKVSEAENGRIALELMELERPNLILLDLMMPEMDGFEFAAEVHQRPEWRSIPIVVLTSKDLTAADRLRLTGYVTNILNKGGYSREELLRQVSDLVANCSANP